MTAPLIEANAAARMQETHFVYEFWTSDGRCLYVGCSARLPTRIQAHQRKDWWPEVARIEMNAYPGFAGGASAEAARIRELNPVHNLALTDHDTRRRSPWPTRLVNEARAHERRLAR